MCARPRQTYIMIALNVALLVIWASPIGQGAKRFYDIGNYFFTLLFAAEALVKITAHSFKGYWESYWNRYDFVVTVGSCMAAATILFGSAVSGTDFGASQEGRWFRCFRVLRILRLVQMFPSLLHMLRTLIYAAPSILNITGGICIFAFVYSQFGMSFLGTIIYDPDGGGFSRSANFETVGKAFASLLRMASGDAWSPMLADALHNPHAAGVTAPPTAAIYIFFLLYMGFMQWILVNVFVAIMLDYFNEADADQGVTITFEDILSFQRKWIFFDLNQTNFMRVQVAAALRAAALGRP